MEAVDVGGTATAVTHRDCGQGPGNRHRPVLVQEAVERRLVAAAAAFDRGGGPTGQLHQPGELAPLMADRVAPAMEVGHHVIAKSIHVLVTVDVGVDLGVIALLLQDCEVMQHLLTVVGSPTEQVLVIQLDEAVGIAVLKELAAVKTALGDSAYKLTNRQIAVAEERLSTLEPLAGHQVLLAEQLLVDGTDERILVAG